MKVVEELYQRTAAPWSKTYRIEVDDDKTAYLTIISGDSHSKILLGSDVVLRAFSDALARAALHARPYQDYYDEIEPIIIDGVKVPRDNFGRDSCNSAINSDK